ncbi:hypothetical protein PQ465_15030 [Sphingobacterium oryzagri]|uniref:DUF962 domain-containing protein n=1 Tax=Sphingobacterium oryzagri TaxID=3025669 RepID=A0ABY7WD88_9SPHI|nr:hypothetical protein [Sphingobacterium sp. KACC 22765]WDF67612.1 hypothetical protein PQ465_15030 [Sphingobacterium sp. KACC 22765]
MNKKDKKQRQIPTFDRPVDRYFYEMDQQFGQGSLIGYAVALALVFFGVMGLVWMIPFPKLVFLENLQMQNFLNWGSFYIAIVIYLYLRLAPTLSYAMLFSIGIMSFLIVQLEYLERAGGPAVWLLSLLLALGGLVLSYFQAKKQLTTLSPATFWRLLTIGPIWLWSKVFASLKIKY